ncbi:hypothetical protein AVEN_101510-1 [Araneus ventricosus]|uniref:Uncharacterized protein n=1 Tax=Araneus ventricosus TaxID=182803 RepID=A0A4Y2RP14_ARAVE|nr:hypothetical protein AVEN_101510-1 [Araneus ventricosus]
MDSSSSCTVARNLTKGVKELHEEAADPDDESSTPYHNVANPYNHRFYKPYHNVANPYNHRFYKPYHNVANPYNHRFINHIIMLPILITIDL